MELTRADTGTCAVLRVSGSVQPLDSPRLREALAKAMAQGPTCLVCDLSAVTRLAPVCVAVLVAAQWTTPWPGPVVWLVGARGQPSAALRATGVARFLLVADSAAVALARQATEPPRLRERLILAPLPTAPRRARRFTEDVLARWAVPEVTQDASLVVSELVTNGVQHAGTDLELRLEHARSLLQIAVRDRGNLSDRLVNAAQASGRHDTPADTPLERGRGLEIVRTIADGSGQTSDPAGGTVYWATLRTGNRRMGRLESAGNAVTESIVVNARRDPRHHGHGWTVRLLLTWRPDDPQHVALVLSSTPRHPLLPAGRWRIRRESLDRALSAPVRDRNVELHPTSDRRVIQVDLNSGQLIRSCRIPALRVQHFLDNLPPAEA